jgi:hypothetical protein
LKYLLYYVKKWDKEFQQLSFTSTAENNPHSKLPLLCPRFHDCMLLVSYLPCFFSRTGYLKHVAKYTSPVQKGAAIRVGEEGADNVNLEGKVIIVTGANSGIGKEIATYAAAKGAKLYMLCRSKERAEKARDEIMKLTSNKDIKVVLVSVPVPSKAEYQIHILIRQCFLFCCTGRFGGNVRGAKSGRRASGNGEQGGCFGMQCRCAFE